MFNYKSTSKKDLNETIIYAFDINDTDSSQISFGFSKSDENSFVDKNIFILTNVIVQENNTSKNISSYKNERGNNVLINYGGKLFGRDIMLRDTVYEESDDKFSCAFFIQNDNIKDNTNSIYVSNVTYQRIPDDVCSLTPVFIEEYCSYEESASKITNEPRVLVIDLNPDEDKEELCILCSDYEVEIINEKGLGFSTVILMESNDGVTKTSNYYFTDLITKNTKDNKSHLRFIISNKGRDFTISSLNPLSNTYDSSVTYIFNESNFNLKDDEDQTVSVRFSISSPSLLNVTESSGVDSVITNLTSNF